MATAKKCAHELCNCTVSEDGPWGEYCSAHCQEADETHTTELYCDCKHPACQLA